MSVCVSVMRMGASVVLPMHFLRERNAQGARKIAIVRSTGDTRGEGGGDPSV